MIEFRKDFYADVRTEDRSRTTISYKAGVLEEMKTREERRASDTAAAYLKRLKGISKARREQGLDLLSRAYRTYSPLQLGPAYRPDANRALL